MVARTPRPLTAEQRDTFVRIPLNLSERDLGRFYTLSDRDLQIINRHRRPANRLGFAVHLGLLRFPGRTLADAPEVPGRIVQYIAEQLGVDPDVFEHYGERDNATDPTRAPLRGPRTARRDRQAARWLSRLPRRAAQRCDRLPPTGGLRARRLTLLPDRHATPGRARAPTRTRALSPGRHLACRGWRKSGRQ
jgi:hypothetical protein